MAHILIPNLFVDQVTDQKIYISHNFTEKELVIQDWKRLLGSLNPSFAHGKLGKLCSFQKK